MSQLVLLIALLAGAFSVFYVKVYQSDKRQFRRKYRRIRSGIRALHDDDPIVEKCLSLCDRRLKWLEVQAEMKSDDEIKRLRADFMLTLERIAQSPEDEIDEFTELLT